MQLPTSPRWQALAAAGLLATGGIVGAVAGHAHTPAIEMAPLSPVAIRSLPRRTGIVTVRARVAETYGSKLVVDDGSARTLVDLGRGGDEEALAADGQTITVQGRFEHDVLHASFLVDAGGSVHALGPMGHPPHEHWGYDGSTGRDGPPPPGSPGAPPPPA